MDPITLIITALGAGASKVGGEAAIDAYHGLMARLRQRFTGNEMAQKVLDEHAKEAVASDNRAGEPGPWDAPLRMYLEKAGAGDDSDLITAAQTVLEAADQRPGADKSIVAIGGHVDVGSGAIFSAGGDVGTAKVRYGR